MFKKFEPIDWIAIVTIIGGLILKFNGADGVVGTTLTAIVLFYFGNKGFPKKDKEKPLPNAKVETIEQTIRRIAIEMGVDPNLAVLVAKCESGLNPNATNTNAHGSVDRGLFQINDRWHPEVTAKEAFNVDFSIRFYCKAVKEGHLSWWNASKKCWGG